MQETIFFQHTINKSYTYWQIHIVIYVQFWHFLLKYGLYLSIAQVH